MYHSNFTNQNSWLKFCRRYLLYTYFFIYSIFTISCTGGSSSQIEQITAGSLQISLEKISGDSQLTTPNTSWGQPLVVRVVAGSVGVPGVPVNFTNTSTALADLTAATVTTDAQGYAKVNAVSPNVSNVVISISASLTDGTSQTFRLETRSFPDTPTMTLRDPLTSSTSYAQQSIINVSIVDVATAVKWCLSESQNTRPIDGNAPCVGGGGAFNGWFIVKPTSFTLTSLNGAKTLYIWVADQFNQVSLNPSNATIFLDTVAPGTPVVTLSDQGSGSTTDTSSSIVNLSVGNDGDASFWCIYTQPTADPVPATPGRTNACWVPVKPTTVTMPALGINQTYIWTKDLAGNISGTYGTQFINYTTLTIGDPSFTISDPVTSSAAYARTTTINLNITNDSSASKWCVSESQSSRPPNSNAACVGGIGSVNGWSTTRPTSMSLSGGEGSKTIYVWVANPLLNTNANAVSRTIILDTIPPSIPLADLTDPNTNLPNFTNQSTVNLSITGDIDAVSWCTYERASLAAPPSIPAFGDACWNGTRPTQSTLGATGTRRVYVYTKDVAQNISPAPAVASINYTTTAPSSPIAVIRDQVTNSSTLAKNVLTNLSINSPTGTVRWCVSETQTTAPATGTATCNGGAGPSSGWYTSSPTTFTLSAGDGLKTVYFWVADGANNVNAVSSTATITLDLTAPATPTVVISDPNSNSTTDTNQIISTLAITNDTHATKWCRIVQAAADSDPSSPSLTDVCWVVSRPTNVILDQTGSRKVFVFTQDAAGNIGSPGIATINYNTDFPSDPSLTIADATTSLTSYAKQASVNLTISNDTGAVKWCVSETQSTRPSLGTSVCSGGLGGSNGWSLAKPTTWTLTAGDGTKRIYVWTANSANSVNSSPSSGTIIRDQVAPSTATISVKDPNTDSTSHTNNSTVTLELSGEDSDVTGWCTIEQSAASADPATPLFSNACWLSSKPNAQTLSATGNRKVFAYFRDRAYNVSSIAGMTTINYSTTPPANATIAITDPTTGSTNFIRQATATVAITNDTGATKWCLSESQTTRPALGTSNCLGGNGAANGWFTTRPTSFTFTNSDGAKTAYLWTADAANTTSSGTVTGTITLDSASPSVPFVTLSDSSTGSTSVTNQTPVSLSIQFDTDADRWCVIEQAVATANPSTPAWNSGCWVAVRPTTSALASTGVRRVFVFTKDTAHNISAAAGVSQINYTTTPPTDPVLVLTNVTTGSTSVTKDLVVTPGITSPTGTVKWCLSETQTTKPATGSSTCTGGAGPDSGWYTSLPSSFTLSAGNNLKTVYIWVADTANNVNANASTGTITLDTTAPATPTVSMTDPNTGSSTQTNQFTVDLSITNDTDAFRWCAIIQTQAAAAPSTPTLTDSCWRTTRPTTQLIDATGNRRLYLFTRDLAGNVGTAGTADIEYGILPPTDPTVTVTHTATGLTEFARSTAVTLSITNDTGATKWCVSESQNTRPTLGTASCNGGGGAANGWFTTRPTVFTLSSTDALKRIYVWTADSFNTVNSNASSAAITLDTTVPTVPTAAMFDPNTNSSTQTNQGTVNLNISSTSDALAWCSLEQNSASAAPSAPLFNDACFVTTKPTIQNLSAVGDRRVYVYVRDRAYNISTTAATADITYSTTAANTATLAISDGTTGSTNFARQSAIAVNITNDTGATKWCLSETQTTRPSLGTSTCAGGSGASSGWHTARPTTFTLTSTEATKTVYLWTADAANNTSAAAVTDTITLDISAPSIPTVVLDDPNTGNTAFTNQATVDLTITDDTDAAEWCVFEQATATAAPSAPLYNNACWVGTRPVTTNLGAQGNRRVYVYTKDSAQNVSLAAAIATIAYSTSAPTDPVLVLSNADTGSKLYTKTRTVSVSINNPAGAVKWCISETQSTQPANGTSTCTGGAGPSSGWYTSMPSTFQLSSGDALKTVYIWVADNSNNTNTNVSSTTITLIETPLSAPTVALADPNTNSTSVTNQGTINLTVTNDAGATAWCSIVQAAAAADPTPPTASDTCWNLTRPTSVSLAAVGNRKVFVFLRDPAVNVSAAGHATIELSTTAPADPTLALAHSVTGLTDYAKTTALNITVANDALATRWCVSETQSVKPSLGTSTCIGGSGGSNGWFTSRPTTYTTTSGDATKRIYVWVANAANNVNENPISTTIILDTAAPAAFTITGITGASDVTADEFLGSTLVPTGNWNSSAGTNSYNVVIRNSAGTTVVCALQTTAATSFNFTGCNLVDGTSYKFYVTASDSAQNTTTATNNAFNFTVNLNPPGAFTIAGVTGNTDTTADQYSGSSLPTISWTASTNVNQYRVRVLANDGVTTICPQQTKSSGILSHDYSTTGCSAVTDNTLYQAEVSATDIAGNTTNATNSVFIFRTDLSAPTVNITGNPAAQSISTSANFTFTSADTISGISAMECKLDSGSFTACNSTTSHSYAGLSDGSHTFTVKAIDAVGLTQTSSFTWDIDTVAPNSFTITGATGATDTVVDNELRNDTIMTANWNASSNATSYEVSILNNDNSVACPAVTKAAGSTSHTFTGCTLANPGTYKINVIARRGYGTSFTATPMTITAVRDSVTATITAASSTVASGSPVLITLVGYQNGVQMTSNVLNPTFSISSGTSNGTFTSITYIGNGTYTVVFTGTTAGTAATITASSTYFGGFTGVTTDNVQVTVGPVSAAVSAVSLNKSSVKADNIDKAIVTAQIRDAAGNVVTGASLVGSTVAGTSTGTFSAFTETPASSGNYVADFMGVTASGSVNIRVTANATVVTSQPSILVLPGAPTKINFAGPTSLTAHSCSGPYSVTLRDYHNNVAQALSNTQINYTGLTSGNFSLSADCSSPITSSTITTGGGLAPDLYVMPRTVSASTILSAADATANLTAGTITVSIAGTLSWIGMHGALNWGSLSGIPARSALSGFVEPRAVWVNEDDKLIYVADTYNNRIVKYDATTKQFKGWIGFTESTGGINCPGQTNPSPGAITPGWCIGGSTARNAPTSLTNWDGVLNRPSSITGDGTYLYVIDRDNHRIVRYLESTGEWKGWYGRVHATNLPTSCVTGTAAGDAATPDWCYGGQSKSRAAATANTTNWDGMFNFTTFNNDLEIFDDGTDKFLIIIDSDAHRVVRTKVGTSIEWQGWAGRVNSLSGLANGPGTTNCSSTISGNATPGWCKGGTSQASQNLDRAACTGPANCASSPLSHTNYNNQFNVPRGLAIITGTPNYAYFADAINGRLVKFNLDNGTTDSWTGRVIRDPGYQGTGGSNCGSTTITETGWCQGGVPVFENYRFYTGTGTNFNPNNDQRAYIGSRILDLSTDGTYLYATLNDHRVLRMDPSGSVIFSNTPWVGRVNAAPSSGLTSNGCNTAATGSSTPGWCLGGGSQAGSLEGQFNNPWGLYVDATNEVIYAIDSSNSKIQTYDLETGQTLGWIGAKHSTTLNWATTFLESIFGFVGYRNVDGALGSGSITNNNSNAYGVVTGPSGLTRHGDYLYVLDTANNRIKRHVASSGLFSGWFGRIATSPTGDTENCTDTAVGGTTPGWCYGGTPGGAQLDQNTISVGSSQLRAPEGIANDGTYLYVSDTNRSRIVRLALSDGSFVGWLGRAGGTVTGMTGYDTPANTRCAAVAANTFTDAFCAGGTHSSANSDGAMSSPRGLAVDTTNKRLFVADTGNHRISMYSTANDLPEDDDRAGRFLGWIGRANGAATAAGPTTGAANSTCSTLTNALTTSNWCLGNGGRSGVDTNSALNFTGFVSPRDVAFDNGSIYVVDSGLHRIQKFNATTGAHLGWIGRAAAAGSTPSGEGSGSGLTSGVCSIALNEATPGWCYRGLSQASGGTVFNNAFNNPTAIWVDPNTDFMYVVDSGNHRITKHHKVTGAFVGWRGMIGANSPTAGPVGCNGAAENTVTPGWCVGGSSKSGSRLGAFNSPLNISGDANFIYVTDSLNSRVVSIPK